MQEADDTRRKLPSEESEFVAHFYCSCHLSDLLDSGPCPPRVSPRLAPLWFSWLPWTHFPVGLDCLHARSLKQGWTLVIPGQPCPAVIPEEYGKGGPHPRRMQTFLFCISDVQHQTPESSFPFLTLLSPCLTNNENISQRGDQGPVRQEATGILLVNILQTIEFVSLTLCKDGTRLVGEKCWILWSSCPQAAENLKGVEVTDLHFFQ